MSADIDWAQAKKARERMTGDIRTKLAFSEAAESLRMENFVASCFRSRKWPAEQGVYYSDPETGKVREVDVICRHILDRPTRSQHFGDPVINLSIICECKSLAGWNVLLLKGDVDPEFENKVPDHWSGYSEHLSEIIEQTTQDPVYRNCDKNLLYSYYSRRAHPDHTQLTNHLQLLQPPVDLVASAFRATKSGSDERQRFGERETINPFWSAIQSVFSATKAAEIRAAKLTRSYTMGIKRYEYERTSEFVDHLAFFFDAELARRVFFTRSFSVRRSFLIAIVS